MEPNFPDAVVKDDTSPAVRLKGPIQVLHEWLTRHKGRKNADFIRTGGEPPDGEGRFWKCTLRIIKGHVGDRRLPNVEFEAEARTKRQAEEAASTLAWEHLKSEGFVTPESLITAAAGGRSARPVWELPRQKCADNPLTFVEISIGGMAVGKIVVEWFVDVAPAAAGSFADLLSKPGFEGGNHEGTDKMVLVFTGVVRGNQLQLTPNPTSISGHPGQGEEAKFLLVHARPYLLSFEPYSLSPWDLSITMNRQASMDGTHEVVGQVLRGFGVLREVESVEVNATHQPHRLCCVSKSGALPRGFDLNNVSRYEDGGIPCWPDDLVHEDLPVAVTEAGGRIALAEIMRKDGNAAFQSGCDDKAIKKYTQAIRFLQWTSLWRLHELSYEDKKRMEQESIKCLLNRAASYQRLGRFHAAAADCRSVLAMNEDHPKALFRLGKALMGSRQLEQAVEALTSAAKMEPNDASVRASLAEAKKKLQDQRHREGRAYAELFSRGGLSCMKDLDRGQDMGCANSSEKGQADDAVNGARRGTNDKGKGTLTLPHLSPEIDASLELFGSLKIPGNPSWKA